MTAHELLFEIGAEEIPAGFLARALAELGPLAEQRLTAARLAYTRVITLGTPRRLALIVEGLAERQPDLEEVVSGPPKKAAYDAAGKPTKAAEAFAAKHGVAVSALELVTTDKGEYLSARRHERGLPTLELLPALLSGLLRAIPWKKSMRWAAYEESFARPVHWLIALYGGERVALEFCGVKSGNRTRGHRFMAPAELEVASAREWQDKLEQAFVIVDPAKRRVLIEAELLRLATEAGARVRPDPALLDEVANLVEWPVGICGSFDQEFLAIPPEVIVSAMRAHQRYFAMEDGAGKLAARFCTIAGTVTRDASRVRAGNERVLRARLSDARFFFEEDRKVRLEERAARLDGVVFQAKLGSIGAKVKRVGEVAAWVATQVAPQLSAADVARAAHLCKADLVSHMVGEFPDLQGVMGRAYALLQGESAVVADAILEHYLPRGAGAELPAGDLGAVIGIADRIDTMVGCFGVGLVPSGSADPYGLRRAAIAILGITLGRKWRLPLPGLIDAAITAYGGGLPAAGKAALPGQVMDFLKTRLRGLVIEAHQLPGDVVDAVLEARSDDAVSAEARARALGRMRARADFEPLGVAFKRVANILKGQAAGGAPDPARFTVDAERALWTAFGEVQLRAKGKADGFDFEGALAELATLKPAVDKFFDDVMVMDKDEALKKNRLALMGTVNALFLEVADFRQLQF